MADGIAPAIDKVGEPAPKAPEAEAAAPSAAASTAAAGDKSETPKAAEKGIPDGAGPAPAPKVPKPVEVVSVPVTPLNNGTPAGGTPRPELKIDEEPKETAKPEHQDPIITKVSEESTPTPKDDDEPIKDKVAGAVTNGASKLAEMTGALLPSEETDVTATAKRKLGEAAEKVTNGGAAQKDKEPSDARSKKARVEDAADEAPATTNGKAKAKRGKKVQPAVGRTARKTRSQGPVEV